jgi:hypothetical protein
MLNGLKDWPYEPLLAASSFHLSHFSSGVDELNNLAGKIMALKQYHKTKCLKKFN